MKEVEVIYFLTIKVLIIILQNSKMDSLFHFETIKL